MQRAYLKIDHPKDFCDSSLFLKKKVAYRTPRIPKFTSTRIFECAEDIPHRIRIRELLLMKEFCNFKYDTEIHIKTLLKITVLWIGKFGVRVNILYHLVYAIPGDFLFIIV